MTYCKRCVCGNVIKYEKKGGAPLRCTKCSRFIAAVTEEVYMEPDEIPQTPAVSVPVSESAGEIATPASNTAPIPDPPTEPHPEPGGSPASGGFAISLETPDGYFSIPVTEPIVVGRNAAGLEYLGAFGDVSREHFRIAPRSNGISATLTDISSWGTYVNGVRMVKHSSIAVSNSTEIRLASRAILILRVKEVNGDA